ncbi:hypothetical protein M434DRAFT_212357 [Hypoxylon sp. CO27-5]|nr:hypothetical protein M434DRAFT_212357 [Hypoxylon sp. CO27-5]
MPLTTLHSQLLRFALYLTLSGCSRSLTDTALGILYINPSSATKFHTPTYLATHRPRLSISAPGPPPYHPY